MRIDIGQVSPLLLTILNEIYRAINSSSIDEVILTNIYTGSTVLTGVINTPADSSNVIALQLANSALSSGANLAGIPIESSEFITSIPIPVDPVDPIDPVDPVDPIEGINSPS